MYRGAFRITRKTLRRIWISTSDNSHPENSLLQKTRMNIVERTKRKKEREKRSREEAKSIYKRRRYETIFYNTFLMYRRTTQNINKSIEKKSIFFCFVLFFFCWGLFFFPALSSYLLRVYVVSLIISILVL